jgi:hypothetical protein
VRIILALVRRLGPVSRVSTSASRSPHQVRRFLKVLVIGLGGGIMCGAVHHCDRAFTGGAHSGPCITRSVAAALFASPIPTTDIRYQPDRATSPAPQLQRHGDTTRFARLRRTSLCAQVVEPSADVLHAARTFFHYHDAGGSISLSLWRDLRAPVSFCSPSQTRSMAPWLTLSSPPPVATACRI